MMPAIQCEEAIMGFRIIKQRNENYFLYKLSGANSEQNFLDVADEIYKDSIEHKINNFILDCAGIRGSLPMGELFDVGNYFAKKLSFCKLAGINTPAEWRNNSFSENVIHNRGGKLEHFQSFEEAQAWFSK